MSGQPDHLDHKDKSDVSGRNEHVETSRTTRVSRSVSSPLKSLPRDISKFGRWIKDVPNIIEERKQRKAARIQREREEQAEILKAAHEDLMACEAILEGAHRDRTTWEAEVEKLKASPPVWSGQLSVRPTDKSSII